MKETTRRQSTRRQSTRQAVKPFQVEELPVFVYGTLRTGQGNWSHLLAGNTTSEHPAVAPNHVMWSRGIAFIADGEGEGEGEVIGDLMIIDREIYQEVMVNLDRLEGIHNRQTGAGYSYCRVKRVVMVDGREVEAWMYHGSSEVVGGFRTNGEKYRVSSGDWLEWQKETGRNY